MDASGDGTGGRRTANGERYRRFIHQDFTEPLPVPDRSFDLLLALCAPGVTKACARYLRAGGLLVSNDHAGDADDARRDETLEVVAVGHTRRNRVVFDDGARRRLLPLPQATLTREPGKVDRQLCNHRRYQHRS